MNDNPALTPKRDKFKQLLKTLFQYQQDRISLDFGIYRVFMRAVETVARARGMRTAGDEHYPITATRG
ncbi:MAG: hypothetical protein Q8O33_06795 [Pseudomonadota bacterium]|nr:hypothetical protein [Pseudomonadota bacterium]